MKANMKVKYIKYYEKENLGQRLKECREYCGIKSDEMHKSRSQICSLETGYWSDMQISSLMEYLKTLKCKGIRILLDSYGQEEVECNLDTIGQELKIRRISQNRSQVSFKNPTRGTVSNIERHAYNCELRQYLNFARQLGIRELKINV